jgi:AcrR family transcriptional regulator
MNEWSPERRKLSQARAKWRLCAAAEVVLARMGTKAKVADVLKQAGMSRRSFYEHFNSLEHIDDQMVYHRTLAGFGPCANWMAWARNPAFTGLLGGDASAAFAHAREVAERGALPVPGNAELLAWFEKRQLGTVAEEQQKRQEVTRPKAEAVDGYDWSQHCWDSNRGGYNPDLIPEWKALCARLLAIQPGDHYEATTDGGSPRCGWKTVCGFELRDGVPSVELLGWNGATWHTVMSLGGLRGPFHPMAPTETQAGATVTVEAAVSP